jgi:hypothetical protein
MTASLQQCIKPHVLLLLGVQCQTHLLLRWMSLMVAPPGPTSSFTRLVGIWQQQQQQAAGIAPQFV